jgi:hypothetical protein
LYILSTKAKLGPGLPSTINRPWIITDHPDEEKINRCGNKFWRTARLINLLYNDVATIFDVSLKI